MAKPDSISTQPIIAMAERWVVEMRCGLGVRFLNGFSVGMGCLAG